MEKVKKTNKIIAEFTKWGGETTTQEIKKEWIDEIVTAIEGQFTIVNKENGLFIRGNDFFKVNIYEVSNDNC